MRRSAVAVLAVVLAALTGSACSSTGTASGPLTVGALLPTTGPDAATARSVRAGIDLALSEIDAAGGVDGQPIRLVTADDGGDPTTARHALRRLVEVDHVEAVIGPSSRGLVLDVLPEVKSLGVLDCSGSTTSNAFTAADDGGFAFRTSPPEALEGWALGELVADDGHTRVAAVTSRDAYGAALVDTFRSQLRASLAHLVTDATFDATGSDATAVAARVARAEPDAVVVLGRGAGARAMLRALLAAHLGPTRVGVYVTDAMVGTAVARLVAPSDPGALAGVRGVVPASSPHSVDHPALAELAHEGVRVGIAAYYYDCTNLLALAALSTGSTDPAQMKTAVTALTDGDQTCQDFASCRDLMGQSTKPRYDGASGPLSFTPTGDPSAAEYEIWAYGSDGVPTRLPVTDVRVG